jgi:diguanylate cyclase (GGDEF)-like protein
MDCEPFQALISAQLDREIQDRERELLELHLVDCPACRAAAAAFAQQDRQLRQAFEPRRRDAGALVERVQAQLSARDQPRCSLLVVDDEPYILPMLTRLLGGDFDVVVADGAEAAQRVFAQRPLDIILTDQKMPRQTGTELLEWVRQHHPETVRLLMTAHGELDDAVEAINRGQVYHYLPKPWRTEHLRQVLRNAAEKRALERKRNQLLEELRQLNQELERRVGERTRELEEANQLLQQRTRELQRMALTDPLTGLFNRRAMDELARFELKRHARYPSPLALGLIDVDHFKRINTDYLLTGGDEVLKGLARVLTGSVREVDSVGRIGGEEFLVIAPETGEEGAGRLAERIRETVAKTPIEHNGTAIPITVSVGFAVADVGVPADYAGMTEAAAAALAFAKQNGRNRCEVRRLSAVPVG